MTHKYKVELFRLFRGHPVPVGKSAYINVNANITDRSLVSKAKEAVNFVGKCHKKDLGNTLVLKPEKSKNFITIKFCQA
jgi:hypothetical protein